MGNYVIETHRYLAYTIPLYYIRSTNIDRISNQTIEYLVNNGEIDSGFYTWGNLCTYENIRYHLPITCIIYNTGYFYMKKNGNRTFISKNCFEWTKSDLSKFILLHS